MIRSHMFSKTYAAFLAIIIVSLVVIGVFAERRLKHAAVKEIEEVLGSKITLIATLIKPMLAGNESIDLNEEYSNLSSAADTRLSVVSPEGEIIADSHEPVASSANQIYSPEIKNADSSGIASAIRYSVFSGGEMLFVAKRIEQDGKNLGYVRLAYPLSGLDKHIEEQRGTIIMVLLVIAALSFIPAYFFSKSITDPVLKIASFIDELKAGEMPVKLRLKRQDEIGQLAASLDAMAEQHSYELDEETWRSKRLASILGAMVEGVIAIDADERVIHLNAVAAEILDADPDASLGKPLWEITRKQAISSAILEALHMDVSKTREIRLIGERRDRIIKINTTALDLGEEDPGGAVLVLQDVTELRQLADLRRDLVTNVSHELKTPLTAIRGITETLLEDTAMAQEQREKFLSRIIDQAERLTNLASDLLELSRVEAGDQSVERSPRDIKLIIRKSFESARETAHNAGLDITYEESQQPVEVTCETREIGQIAENLIDNAINYTPKGGTVNIEVKKSGDRAVIIVRDTGLGIEPMAQERVFERFYRVDKARSQRVKGTGLGLAIVKSITESLGGSIELESKPGAGSTFRVFLPLSRA